MSQNLKKISEDSSQIKLTIPIQCYTIHAKLIHQYLEAKYPPMSLILKQTTSIKLEKQK